MNAIIFNPKNNLLGNRLQKEIRECGYHASVTQELPKHSSGPNNRPVVFIIVDDNQQIYNLLSQVKMYQKEAFSILCLVSPITDTVDFYIEPFDVWHLPQDFSVIKLKMKQLIKARHNSKEMYDLSDQVDYFTKRLQEEHVFADHVFKNQVNFDAMYDPAIRYWINSSENMNADLIAGARTPNDTLHMILADPRGQGLPAVVATLPLTAPFYAMTSKGLPLSEIAYELNRKAKTFLPQGYNVKITLVAVDANKQTIEVWNAGNPAPVLLDSNGRIIKRFISKHEPLGILDSTSFDSMTEEYEYKMPCQLFAYSDGVREISHSNGTMFNEDDFLRSLEGDDSYFRFSDAVAYIEKSLNGSRPVDDVAMFMLECPMLEHSENDVGILSSQTDIVRVQWKNSWTFHSEEIKYLNIPETVLSMIKSIPELSEHYDNVKFILDELILNAIDHGLLLMTAEDKHASERIYKAVRDKKLKNLNHGTLEISTELQIQGSQKRIILHVKDSGPGFNYRQMVGHAGTMPVEYTGKGIKEMKQRVELLEYMGSGNDVMVYYALDGHTIEQTKPVIVKHRGKKIEEKNKNT